MIVSPPLNDRQFDDLISGRVQLPTFGGRICLRLGGPQRDRFMEAKRAGYLVSLGGGEMERRLLHIFSRWCDTNHLPIATVTLRSVYADVEMDLLCRPAPLNAAGDRALSALCREFDYRVRSEVHRARRVSAQRAEGLARMMLEIAHDPDFMTDPKTESKTREAAPAAETVAA